MFLFSIPGIRVAGSAPHTPAESTHRAEQGCGHQGWETCSLLAMETYTYLQQAAGWMPSCLSGRTLGSRACLDPGSHQGLSCDIFSHPSKGVMRKITVTPCCRGKGSWHYSTEYEHPGPWPLSLLSLVPKTDCQASTYILHLY